MDYFILLLTLSFIDEGDLDRPKFNRKINIKRPTIVSFKNHTQFFTKDLYFGETYLNLIT